MAGWADLLTGGTSGAGTIGDIGVGVAKDWLSSKAQADTNKKNAKVLADQTKLNAQLEASKASTLDINKLVLWGGVGVLAIVLLVLIARRKG